MFVGPLVYWWGGTGAAPPATPSDKFTAKYLVGNSVAGDGTSTSVAGFTYILDPGDGSGIQLALTQPSGFGDVYIRPGSYVAPAPQVLTIPSGVRVTGAGRAATVLTGIGFITNEASAIRDMTITVDTGIAVQGVAPSVNMEISDVLIELNGVATTGMYFEGSGSVTPPFDQLTSIDRVQVEITALGAFGLHANTGALLVFNELAINGGAEAVRAESDSAVFGSHGFFSGSSMAGIRILNGTGAALVRIEECVVISTGTSVLLSGGVDACRFHNCFLIGVAAGINAVNCNLSNMACTGCTITAERAVVGLATFQSAQARFDACNLNGYNGSCVDIGSLGSGISFVDSSLQSNGSYALLSSSKVTASASTFTSDTGIACSLNGVGSNNMVGCSFVSFGSSPCVLEVTCPDNVFSGLFVMGPDAGAVASVRLSGSGSTFSSLSVTSLTLGVPSVIVSGRECTLSTVRTITDVGQPGVIFDLTSTNNILLGLNARGPGSSLLAVSDLGVTNEMAHIIGT